MAVTISVQPFEGPSPAPCAVIIIEGVASSGVQAMVTRTADGINSTVRGGRKLMVYGAANLVDYDVPLGVDVTYTVTVNGEQASAPYRVDSLVGWITDPFDPSKAASIATSWSQCADLVLHAGTALSSHRAAGADLVQVLGASRPVATASQRQASSSVPFTLMTMTDEGRAAASSILESPIIVVRHPPSMLISELSTLEYLLIPDVQATHTLTSAGGAFTTWKGTVASVRALSKPITWAAWTYNQISDLMVAADGVTPLTYSQVDQVVQAASYRYVDQERDPRIGGAL